MTRSLNTRIAYRIQPHLYYGWVVVGVVFFSNVAAFHLGPTFGLFITPLEQEFGWSRGDIARSLTLGTVAGVVLSPMLGILVDRIGVRMLMVGFGLCSAVSYVLLSAVEQIWQFNLLIGLTYALGTMAIGQMMGGIAINNWFLRRRGRAMGMVMMGASAGAMVFVPLFGWLIGVIGWRQTYLLEAAISVCLISVPVFILMVHRPEMVGLGGHRELSTGQARPSSDRHRPQPQAAAHAQTGWTLREAAGTRAFWLTLAGLMLGSFSLTGYFIHAVPLMEHHGFSRTLASSVWATFFLTGVVAKFIWGFVIERIGVRLSLVFLFTWEAVGIWLLLNATTPAGLFTYAVLNGLGHGPYLQLLSMVWAEYFGRQSLGRIFGTVQPGIVLASSLGPWLGGYMYDRFAGYTEFMIVCMVMTLLAAGLFALDAPPHKRAARLPGAG